MNEPYSMPNRIQVTALIVVSLTVFIAHDLSAQSCSQEQIDKLVESGFAQAEVDQFCPNDFPQLSGGSAAFEDLEELVRNGNASAAHMIGTMYEHGDGVIQDFIEAYVWYSLAVALAGSQEHIDSLDAIETRMTPKDIEIAQESASERFVSTSPNTTIISNNAQIREPVCRTEYREVWIAGRERIEFWSDTFEGNRAQACSTATHDAQFSLQNDTCSEEYDDYEFRNVEFGDVIGRCECTDLFVGGTFWACNYEGSVMCHFEELIEELYEVCE